MVNQGSPLVIEIWNLVFMQFNRKANGSLEPLAANCIDTGMGFERLCMILQGKKSNYDTDVFQPTIQRIAAMSGKTYGADEKCDVAMRVVADHLRAISFSIADGQLPSNVKAGYVIRRILRRAVRYGYTYLGFNEPFICRLVAGLVDQMGGQFPELKAQQTLIEKVIEEEESSFLRTLATGINLLDGVMAEVHKSGGERISGKDAFLLYDTYGFPIDLTELIAREQGIEVDLEAFEKELQAQKERSRNAAAVDTDDWKELIHIKQSEFIGYDTLSAEVKIARYRRVSSKGRVFLPVGVRPHSVLRQFRRSDRRYRLYRNRQRTDPGRGYREGERPDYPYRYPTARKSRGDLHGRRGSGETSGGCQQPYGDPSDA